MKIGDKVLLDGDSKKVRYVVGTSVNGKTVGLNKVYWGGCPQSNRWYPVGRVTPVEYKEICKT